MPEREDDKPDVSQSAVRAVEEITGGKLLDEEDEVFADPETERKYREAMAKERERKSATVKK